MGNLPSCRIHGLGRHSKRMPLSSDRNLKIHVLQVLIQILNLQVWAAVHPWQSSSASGLSAFDLSPVRSLWGCFGLSPARSQQWGAVLDLSPVRSLQRGAELLLISSSCGGIKYLLMVMCVASSAPEPQDYTQYIHSSNLLTSRMGVTHPQG